MIARRIPLGLLAPVSLVILVIALGALQYRWVGQVSEADRQQLRESLDRRAREFADDFDREIGRAYQTFRPAAGFSPAAPDRFASQYDDWHSSSRFPALVKHAYFAAAGGGAFTLHRYDPDTRTFNVVDWPDTLAPVRDRLQAQPPESSLPRVPAGSGPASVIAITTLPVLPDVPALVIPETQTATATAGLNAGSLRLATPQVPQVDVMVAMRGGRNSVILELDREFIAATMLPALADRHFPDSGSDRFKVSVVDGSAQVVLARGLPAGQTLAPAAADAAAGFFGVRIETFRNWVSAAPSVTAGRGGRASAFVMAKPGEATEQQMRMVIEQHAATVTAGPAAAVHLPAGPGWTVLLQHGAGSLDAAVGRARRRNLWLSFGILGVLAASAGLVMVNARRAEKLAAQQMDFVATVSHELRTPLAVIRTAAQNLSAGVIHEAGQAQRYGELIETEGRRLTDMVEQVLEYAGLSGHRPIASRPVDAGRLVRDVVSTAETLPEASGVTFEVRVDDGAPAVMADEDAIRRAVMNLVNNALKYAGDAGWIGVIVARGAGRDEGQVLVSVSDRGRGIPADELTHIFEPFYRGSFARDRQIHGNGLGLSLVKRIADAHGGRVTVISAPDQGSTFTLHLPVAAGAVAASPATDVRAIGLDEGAAPSPGGHSA